MEEIKFSLDFIIRVPQNKAQNQSSKIKFLPKQINEFMESNPRSEQYPDEIRMLITIIGEDDRLITFRLPNDEACTLKELFENINVTINPDVDIDIIEYLPSTGLNYFVIVGYPPKATKFLHCQEHKDSETFAKETEIANKTVLGSSNNRGKDTNCEQFSENLVELQTIITCKVITVGSCCINSGRNLITRLSGFTLEVPLLKDPHNFISITVSKCEIAKVLVYFTKNVSVIFYSLLPSAGIKIQEQLNMGEGLEPYFDPACDNEKYKWITITFEGVSKNTETVFEQIYSDPYNTFNKLTIKEASDLYYNVCPAALPEYNSLISEEENELLLNYPLLNSKGVVKITKKDYTCLSVDAWLNDVIIEFYLNYVVKNLPEEQKEKVYLFPTFFFQSLKSACLPSFAKYIDSYLKLDQSLTASQKKYSRVKNWTKNVNIFEKDFVIVPINEHGHWFLAIICFPGLDGPMTLDGKPVELMPKLEKVPTEEKTISPRSTSPLSETISEFDSSEDSDEETSPVVGEPIKQPCILIFDSLFGKDNKSHVVSKLRNYLTCEYNVKVGGKKIFHKDLMKAACLKVPQQQNGNDCGVYLLQFVEQFFKDPITNYHIPVTGLELWFDDFTVFTKRRDIAFLIVELMKMANKDADTSSPIMQASESKEEEM